MPACLHPNQVASVGCRGWSSSNTLNVGGGLNYWLCFNSKLPSRASLCFNSSLDARVQCCYIALSACICSRPQQCLEPIWKMGQCGVMLANRAHLLPSQAHAECLDAMLAHRSAFSLLNAYFWPLQPFEPSI